MTGSGGPLDLNPIPARAEADGLAVDSLAWRIVQEWARGGTVPTAKLGEVLRRYADVLDGPDPAVQLLRAQLAAVEQLHRPVDVHILGLRCRWCTDSEGVRFAWPCPTTRALDVPPRDPDGVDQ